MVKQNKNTIIILGAVLALITIAAIFSNTFSLTEVFNSKDCSVVWTKLDKPNGDTFSSLQELLNEIDKQPNSEEILEEFGDRKYLVIEGDLHVCLE